MVSAISLCLLALGLSAASSHELSDNQEFQEVLPSDRRTFMHGKPGKLLLPFGKKHKKYGGLIPHVLNKPSYSEISIIHDAPKPFYKGHKYHGVEVPSDISFSTVEPYIETHSIEPPAGHIIPSFDHDHHHTIKHPPVVLPVHDKPLVPLQPVSTLKPFVMPYFTPPDILLPAQQHTAQPSVLSSIPFARPAAFHSYLPPSTFHNHVNAVYPSVHVPFLTLPPVQPLFHLAKFPYLPPSFPTTPQRVKVPLPLLTTPVAPALPPLSIVSPTPAPVLPANPISLPPPQFQTPLPPPQFQTPLPPPQFQTPLPPLAPLPSIPATPEPEFPYPPSGSPVGSYVHDLSLGDVEIKDSVHSTVAPLEEVTSGAIPDAIKVHDHAFGVIKPDAGLFQKFKGWKTDKVNLGFTHLNHFKPKPQILSQPPNKIPLEIPTFPNYQIPGSNAQLPPATIFFPPGQFLPPAKYESFPPNNIESPPLFNSYGAPIPHDTYAHIPHDRLSSAASEEEPAVVAAPAQNKPQIQQQRFQPQAVPEQPIYEEKTKEENKLIEEVRPESDEYKTQNEQIAEDAASNYPNHKE